MSESQLICLNDYNSDETVYSADVTRALLLTLAGRVQYDLERERLEQVPFTGVELTLELHPADITNKFNLSDTSLHRPRCIQKLLA